jgi:four helix bundle protein
MATTFTSFRDLRVYQNALEACLEVLRLTDGFPAADRAALGEPLRRASRVACTGVVAAWSARRDRAMFEGRLDAAAAGAAEAQVLVDLSRRRGCLGEEPARKLEESYGLVAGQIGRMAREADKWVRTGPRPTEGEGGAEGAHESGPRGGAPPREERGRAAARV